MLYFLQLITRYFDWKISLWNLYKGKKKWSNDTSSIKENNYNVFVISVVFLLGAFITFLNSTFMNVDLSNIMELKF